MSSGKKYVKLSGSFRKDLRWWFMFVNNQYNGVSFIPPAIWAEPDYTFSTDSSLKGCGGISAHEYFHVQFPKAITDQDLKIHALEMLAMLIGVRIWGHYLLACEFKFIVIMKLSYKLSIQVELKIPF